MTPLELQHALAQLPSRAAQSLIFRCIEQRSPQECADLYGIDVPRWEVLFFEAACGLASEAAPLDDATRRALATQLQAELSQPGPQPLRVSAATAALSLHREEVHRLIVEADRAAAASPARAREAWLRRLAVVLIIAVSLFVWLRERNFVLWRDADGVKPPTPSHFPLPPRGLG